MATARYSLVILFIFVVIAKAQKLSWAPPVLSNPITLNVAATGSSLKLNQSRDYIIRMPGVVVTGVVELWGGRNIHLIGGEVKMTSMKTQALKLQEFTGTLHVEGLRIDPGGSQGFENDAIRVNSRYDTSVAVFQNIWVDKVSMRACKAHTKRN